MSKTETFTQELANLENRLEEKRKALNSIQELSAAFEASKSLAKFKAVSKWLAPVIEDTDIVTGDTYFTVSRINKEGRKKEMFNLEVHTDWTDAENVTARLNYYTCGATDDPFELNRLMALGKVAEHLSLNGEALRAQVLELEFKGRNPHNQALWDKEREMQELRNSIRELNTKMVKELILSGKEIKFTSPVKSPDNMFSRSYMSYSNPKLASIQTIDQTSSGKTVTMNVTYFTRRSQTDGVMEAKVKMRTSGLLEPYFIQRVLEAVSTKEALTV